MGKKQNDAAESQFQERLAIWQTQKRAAGYGDASMRIPEEPPEEVEIPEHSSPQFSMTIRRFYCCFSSNKYSKHKTGYYKEATAIRNFRTSLQNDYNRILKLTTWPEFPAREHQSVEDANYISSQIWIYSFAAVELEDINAKKQHFDQLFEALLVQAERLGMELRKFLKPLAEIQRSYLIMERMSILIDTRMNTVGVDNIVTTSEELMEKSILKGNHVKNFDALHIYIRDTSEMKWAQLKSKTHQDQIAHIKHGISQAIDSVNAIAPLVNEPVQKLQNAKKVRKFQKSLSLIPHMNRMYGHLRDVIRNEGLSRFDEDIIKALFLEANVHVLYVIQAGRNVVTRIWQILLMTRLCYTFMHEWPNSQVNLRTIKQVLDDRLDIKKEAELLLKSSNYDWEDFFEVKCPDSLRAAPVIIHDTIELALHHEGHTNPAAATPSVSHSSLLSRQTSDSSNSSKTSTASNAGSDHGHGHTHGPHHGHGHAHNDHDHQFFRNLKIDRKQRTPKEDSSTKGKN